jgi:hypothetical protein
MHGCSEDAADVVLVAFVRFVIKVLTGGAPTMESWKWRAGIASSIVRKSVHFLR